jgi:hypothetical protein
MQKYQDENRKKEKLLLQYNAKLAQIHENMKILKQRYDDKSKKHRDLLKLYITYEN